ncbi:MAG TPA: altronate dehydratase family protein [Gemmatimonadaceae bacterium]|nr:altronate dehydratase family protein [Gemmatimonadaceae bacterium]
MSSSATLANAAAARANRPAAIRIAEQDNVAIALRPIAAGEQVRVGDETITARQEIPAGHKLALSDVDVDQQIVKYGVPIGLASAPIARGDWVHSHNLRTALSGVVEYAYRPSVVRGPSSVNHGPRTTDHGPLPTFRGYRRKNGKVGTRNELWVLNTVGCVNHAAERIARQASERFAGKIDGIHAFAHPYGCSQLGDDLQNTQRVLAGLLRHPNAGGVLILGLGCENNQLSELMQLAGDVDRDRVAFFNTQDVIDELEEGTGAVATLVERIAGDRREDVPVSELVLGHKCGGSDGFSGISANALVGRIADRVTGDGGSVLLTEVPEMFGAEQLLMNRAESVDVFNQIVEMVNDFKNYFLRHDQPVYENPSPGNKAGGLTTLEEKSLGAVQKGGRAPVSRVLRYGEPLAGKGLTLLESPGNDGVSSTAMTVSGATVLLFTTGRGTPLGFPVPTIKISSNSEIAAKKPHWIDFNAGALLDGTKTMAQLEDDLFALILAVASGDTLTNNEKNGYREIAIWKEGVTL